MRWTRIALFLAVAFSTPVLALEAPPLGASGRRAFAEFLQAEWNRAFAVSADGGWGWAAVRASAAAAAADALDSCAGVAKTPCRLYAVDDRLATALPDSGPSPTLSVFRLVPGLAFRGGAAATGAIVWSHGRAPGGADSRHAPMQPWVARFAAAGWDVWRFDRDPADDEMETAAERLKEGIAALRQAGYAKVISAGQSRGGWHSLAALDRPGLLDGVIAIAPAMHGTGSHKQHFAAPDWRRLVDGVADPAARLVVATFEGDEYDPDPAWRADLAHRRWAARGQPHLVLDRPAGLAGHGGGTTAAFDRAFGDCLVRFMRGADAPCAPQADRNVLAAR